MAFRIGRKDGVWYGYGSVPLSANAKLVVREVVDEAPIRYEVGRQLDQLSRSGGGYEYGLNLNPFHYAGRTLANTKLAAEAIVRTKARKKLLKKLGNGVKKSLKVAKDVYESPVFAVTVGVVSAAVPGAQGLLPAYALSRAALKLAEQIKAGDPAAIQTGSLLAQAAAAGSPEAQATLFEVQRATASIDATVAAAPDLVAMAGSPVRSVMGCQPCARKTKLRRRVKR